MILSNDGPLTSPETRLEANGTGSHNPKMTTNREHTVDTSSSDSSIPSHPLGIKPLGNQYLSDGVKARQSIGTVQVLPDEVLSQLLEYLDQRALRLLGYTCRFLYAHSVSDELWKALFLG